MKVSVLVAVYNTEHYLPVCLDSLLNQTHRDIQVICIDDASTDNSWMVLQEYAARDSRIVLLRQPVNQGQAKARNKGLEVADGDFVTMLDSDDWLSPDAFEQACRMAELHPAADSILLEVMYHDDATGREWPYAYRTPKNSFTGEEAFLLSLDWSIHGLYLIRRSIHMAYPYDDSCRLYSDDNTTRLHFLHSREVWRCGGIYYYRQHANSMTHQITPMRFEYLRANYNMMLTLQKEGVSEEIKTFYEEHRWLNVVGLYVFYWNNRAAFTAEQRKEIKKNMRFFWASVEAGRLPACLTRKFGYIPFKKYPFLFEAEVWAYAGLRRFYYNYVRKSLPDSN